MGDNTQASTSAIIEPSTSIDISKHVTSVIENANSVRLRYINDFISQLEKDFKKYGNAKRKFIKIKNILFLIDFFIGGTLVMASIIIQIVGADSKITSAILCAVGAICISFLPVITKIAEQISNKNRNFEQLAVKKLNMCKQIFSRSIEDSKISHEELLEVFECKNQYENAMNVLKVNNQKEVEELFKNGATVIKDNSNVSKNNIKDKIAQLITVAESSALMVEPTNKTNVESTPSIYPSLKIV